MIVNPGSSRLRARTVAIPDPGPLELYLTRDARCFLHRGDGLVALGDMLRFETDSLDAADVWWTETAATIENETELPGVPGTGPIAFGSFAFDPDHTTHRSFLMVPEVVIGRHRGHTWLTRFGWNDVVDEMPRVQPAAQPPQSLTWSDGAMSTDEWKQMVSQAVDRIRAGELDKVVLTRDVIGHADEALDPRWIVERLSATHPWCWSYLMDGLVGATPAILLRLVGGLATSRVLTTTLLRGDDDAVYAAKLADAFNHDSLAYRSHGNAVAAVADTLAPYCDGMHVPDSPSVLELSYATHMTTDITGAVLPGASSLGLAAALHPTPAVTGSPPHVARDLITEIERLDRGRFAGPIGWVDSMGNGEWGVAMRGGRIEPQAPYEIQLLAGCGIDAGSSPDDEVLEAEAKFSPIVAALTP